MSHTGDAADQVVQMATTLTTEAAKTAVDITVKSLTQILTLMMTNGKNTSERKKNVLRDIISKPHDVFLVPKDRMREFVKRCKEYNIPFFVVKRTKHGPEPFVDVIVREMDRGAVNRIAEQMGVTLSFVEQAREGMDHIRTQAEDAGDMGFAAAPEEASYTVGDDVLSQMLGDEDATHINPIPAQTVIINPSAPLYESSSNFARDSNPADFEPISIRSTIRIIQAERTSLPKGLPAGREPARLPDAQRLALPPGKVPQLPAPKVPNIEVKGR